MRPLGIAGARTFGTLLLAGGLTLSALVALAEEHHDGRDDRDARRDTRGHEAHRRPMRQPYRRGDEDRQPIYAPAPVYYPPQPESGISLFLPFNLHR